MASKSDRFYFENFTSAAEIICEEADFLTKCLSEYDPDSLKEMLTHMHELEHRADGCKHDMSAALAKAFVTPLDREDLASMSQSIDDVADKLEEILQRFYIHGINRVLPEAVSFSEKIGVCCSLMKKLMSEFANFKKFSVLKELIIEVNNTEEECDRLYLGATAKVRTECTDVLEIVAWREIFDYMEDCVDACEHVADCVETVVMKNT